MVKYIVRLNTEEREELLAFVNTGRAAAAKLLHARILLKADVGAGDCSWTDAEIAAALDNSAATVHRVRQTWVEQGLEAALARKRPTGRQYRKLDGAQEAQLIAVACRAPPEGRVRWTLKL
jgi:transposase